MIGRLLDWMTPRYRPGVFYSRATDTTEILLRDTATVSAPFPGLGEGHLVDLMYDFEGELVGVRVWADVRKRHRRAA